MLTTLAYARRHIPLLRNQQTVYQTISRPLLLYLSSLYYLPLVHQDAQWRRTSKVVSNAEPQKWGGGDAVTVAGRSGSAAPERGKKKKRERNLR
ncbi:hypothetical protein TNIN_118921 [Trichonephila inaurata madagascariensis]|uniref:Uncharacterized protein n=1 Tax=Trichonephila inaurata madagascariensis TaxID=2747483 RepID=A0A8X6YVG7_9ARAC|nr:hypothetical protein TNIN_118921 [Trichonephila inaurata madagascariensis]